MIAFVRCCLLGCLVFAGPGSALAAPAGEGTIRIGVAGAHSGDLASYGIPTLRAVELVASAINARGGINGKKIELVKEDDVCKPEVATNTATRLIAAGVPVVIGHTCSGATRAALPLYKAAGITLISPSATNPALTQSGDYPAFFRTIAPDDAQARTEVDFALGTLGLRKIAVIHDKGDYGRGLAEAAKNLIAQSGTAQVVLYEGISPGAVDYSAVVQKIKRSGAEAVLYGGYHPEASKIVGQMRKKKMQTVFISDDGVKDDTFIRVAGVFAEGVYASGPADVKAHPITRAARDEHRRVYGEDPGAFFDNAYTAALALTSAIGRAGSTEAGPLGIALRGQAVDTPFGAICFDQRGDAIGVGFTMYRVENGSYVQQRPAAAGQE
ncbi:MAG: branched chain amino acid ABC transporter substrate-binding protein [Desulfobulbaceae bacterium A2]|nr:MAG: branched chain amino acid ABC transporter substrate-binding protein [Desulfobulbaceae bacterium A2]